jgi:hypothetical protein
MQAMAKQTSVLRIAVEDLVAVTFAPSERTASGKLIDRTGKID